MAAGHVRGLDSARPVWPCRLGVRLEAERDIRGFAVKFHTEEGNWDMVG